MLIKTFFRRDEGTGTLSHIGLVPDGEVKLKITDPKGNEIIKTIDKSGRLKTVESDGEATTNTYYDNGSRKEVIYPNGSKETYVYNDRGEITVLTNKKADDSIIEQYSYTYDNNGNQLSKTDSTGTTNYTYDSLNRLKTIVEPDGTETSYDFDGAGNRTSQLIVKGGSISLTTYTYDNQNQLKKESTQYQGNAKITNYEYDSNGNLVSKSNYEQKPSQDGEEVTIGISTAGNGNAEDVTLYEYDLYNQLIKTIADNKTVIYDYDSVGYRIEKIIETVNTETNETIIEETRYAYSGDKVILETDGIGTETAVNVYGINLISRRADGSKLYYLYNAHADVTGLADSGGNIIATYKYDAFDNITSKTGDTSNPYTYAGYQYDEESDLYYLNARYYDAKIARFLTIDTYKGEIDDPLSLNLYTYCANNPIMYVDPSGHIYDDIIDKGLGGIFEGGTGGDLFISLTILIMSAIQASMETSENTVDNDSILDADTYLNLVKEAFSFYEDMM